MKSTSTLKTPLLLCLLVVVLSGCEKGLERTSPIASAEYQARPQAAADLFGTDEAVLRGASLEQVLTSKVVIPQKARLAIMQFGERRERRYWQGWSEEFARLDENLESGFRKIILTPSF